MKNLLKYSMVAAATMTLAGSVYAIPTVVVEDGNGGTIAQINTSASGTVTISTADGFWSVVVSTGISSPPAIGQGTAASPVMDLDIVASYIGNGTAGTPLTISFGSDNFGPTDGGVIATLTGHAFGGTGATSIGFTTLAGIGSNLPTLANPKITGAGVTQLTSTSVALGSGPAGSYFSSLTGGPLNLTSYSLDEVITLTATSGVTYSIDASLVTVPDGGMTLVLLGSALSGLALIKRKLA